VAHIVLAGLSLCALYAHAIYRVPMGPLTLVLPWIGVALTALSIGILVLGVFPARQDRVLARALDRLDRRSLSLIALLVASGFAGAYAVNPVLRAVGLLLGVSVLGAAITAAVRRMLLTGGAPVVARLRHVQIVAHLVAGLFLAWSVVVLVNGASDRSPGVEYDADVLGMAATVIDPGLGNLVPHTRADVSSWRRPGGVEHLVLAPWEMRAVWIGQPVRVRVHPGALGIPWISALKIDDVRHARQILAVSPRAFIAMKRLTWALLERRQWDDALVAARQFAAAYPDDTGGLMWIVGIFGAAERYTDQIELIRPVVARAPSYQALIMLGFALDRSGDHHGAIPILEQATRLEPRDFFAWHYLGEANQAIERYEAAIAAYEQELTIRPNSREVRRRVRVFRAYLASR
jgi:hypothetical protein